jgi:uncharacterized protein YgbK (DUF1537 family)
MLLGVIADDFTGASDIANTLARGGMATTQWLGVPRNDAAGDCEAGVVALKTRSIAAEEAVALSLQALAWLQRQGCRQFVFKYCSTFDSTPRGNIGPVGEALAQQLGVAGVVACPAFPATGRTVYQGHLFVGDRLLHETSLRDHPLNPMTDADLRRWLARQCRHPVGLVAYPAAADVQHLRQSLAASAGRGEVLVIVDAIDEAGLRAIAEACADAPLLTGGSGIALGLAQPFRAAGLLRGHHHVRRGVPGPAAALAGSCSARTLEQVAAHARNHPAMRVDVDAVLAGAVTPAQAAAFIADHPGQPLVYSSATADELEAARQRWGRERAALAIEGFLAATAREAVQRGVRRLVVAGGETSGAVVGALALESLEIGPEIDPGVPALFSRAGHGLGLALKSGNFGSPEFFARAFAVLEGSTLER